MNHFHSSGKLSRRQIDDIFFFFFPENRFWYFMQIVSNGDNMQVM